MKYIDTGRVGRDRAPRGPKSKHGENTLPTIAGRSGIAPCEGKSTYFIAGALKEAVQQTLGLDLADAEGGLRQGARL